MKKIILLLIVVVLAAFSFEEDVITVLQNKSGNFFSSYKRAKLELYFNQPTYAPGDTAHFTIRYVNASDFKTIPGKQVVHLLLFDQSGKNTMTQWASVVNGTASCQMVVPTDFPSGNYLIVAFTDWMKNFDKSLFFRQPFQVAGKHPMIKVYPKDSLIFYPEGGNLVAEVENNLAIRYQGKDLNATIRLKEEGNVIGTFPVKRDSIITFQFTPKIKGAYVAELVEQNALKSFQLPGIKDAGAAIRLLVSGKAMKLKIQLAKSTPSSGGIYLAVFSNSGLVFNSSITSGTQNFEIDLPSNLPSGILQLVLFDSKFNLLASRVIHQGEPANKKIAITGLSENYNTRQASKAVVQIAGESGYSLSGDFACRIIHDDLLSESSPQPLGYFTFQSDISNSFELHQIKPTSTSINNYLITQTCPWFEWNKIIDGKRVTSFKPQEYLVLSGKAAYAKNGKPVNDSTLLMFFLEKNLQGYETHTSHGGFSFPLFLTVNQSDKFFYTASFRGNDVDDVIVKMHNPDSVITFAAEPWDWDKTANDPYAVFSAKKNLVNNSFAFFINSEARKDSINDRNKAIEDELNGADVVVNLKDYLQMPTMIEVVRELVRAVEYRKINGRDVVRVYTTQRKPTNKTGPLYVIDGQITKDPSYFLSLKPSEVISFKVVKDSRKLFVLGRLGDNGVILIKTKNQNVVVRDSHRIDFPGFLPSSKLVTSGKSNLQIPDFRSCLYWSPKIVLKGAGSQEINFNTSDDVGKFKLQVYGVGEDGAPFYGEQPFTVKFSKNQ